MKKLFIFTISLLISQTATCMDIFEAIKEGNLGRVQKLINENPEVVNALDEWQYTLLHKAAERGHTTVVSVLLDKSANVNAPGHSQFTPLHLAAEDGHPAVVSVLLDRGANVNAQAFWNRTPLHQATDKGHADVATVLLRHRAHVNALDRDNKTPLHLAAENGHPAVASVLLNSGANVNAPAMGRKTPLHQAAENGHATASTVLLYHGANIKALDNDNKNPFQTTTYYYENTVLEMAAENRFTAVIRLLKDWPYYQRRVNKNREAIFAFCMAQNDRCGAESPAHTLARNLYQKICKLVSLQHTPAQIHTIVEQERKQQRTLTKF